MIHTDGVDAYGSHEPEIVSDSLGRRELFSVLTGCKGTVRRALNPKQFVTATKS